MVPGRLVDKTGQVYIMAKEVTRCGAIPMYGLWRSCAIIRRRAGIAQLVEHLTCNQGVTSSILVAGTNIIKHLGHSFGWPKCISGLRVLNVYSVSRFGTHGTLTIHNKFQHQK